MATITTTVSDVTDALKDTLTISTHKTYDNEPKQPDIQYHPDELKWKARTARRLTEDPTLPSAPLPQGFPAKVESPLVWEGKDWKSEKEWVYDLSEAELKEIDDAVHHFHGTQSTQCVCSDFH